MGGGGHTYRERERERERGGWLGPVECKEIFTGAFKLPPPLEYLLVTNA